MRCPACQTEIPKDASACVKCAAAHESRHTAELPPPPSTAVPERLENFQIARRPDGSLWELGRGTMGITYKAFDTDLRVPVVLKVINPAVLGNADTSERFLSEARTAGRLHHPNIATVLRLGDTNGLQFYAMEYCDGETVHQFVERHGALELKLALEIALQVATALVAAQELGLVHRDIKPANLMVTGRPPEEFTVKVIDFGLAKLGAPGTAACDATVATSRFGFVGTAHYASPEQLQDRPLDFRSDIYSLGATLFFMLAARPLFDGATARVVMQHLLDPPPLESIAWLPPKSAALLAKMLAKDPGDRPSSTQELCETLRVCLLEARNGQVATFAAAVVSRSSAIASRDDSTLPPSAAEEKRERLTDTLPGAGAELPSPVNRGRPRRNALVLAAVLLAALASALLLTRARQSHPEPVTNVPIAKTPADPPPASPEAPDPQYAIALQGAQAAQQAAERLSIEAHSFTMTHLRLERAQAQAVSDPETVQNYRAAEEALERNIAAAEAAYLDGARRLRATSPEAQRAAFTRVADDVARNGSLWQSRVTEIIREDISQLPPDADRVHPETREALRVLQAGR